MPSELSEASALVCFLCCMRENNFLKYGVAGRCVTNKAFVATLLRAQVSLGIARLHLMNVSSQITRYKGQQAILEGGDAIDLQLAHVGRFSMHCLQGVQPDHSRALWEVCKARILQRRASIGIRSPFATNPEKELITLLPGMKNYDPRNGEFKLADASIHLF